MTQPRNPAEELARLMAAESSGAGGVNGRRLLQNQQRRLLFEHRAVILRALEQRP